ncbi:MAG: hypothetical protein WBC91_14805 [Phototrophicaceae bacterium]
MIKRLALLVIMLLITTTTFAQQDENTWSAYLLDTIDYALVRIDADGTTDAFSLGLETDAYINQNEIVVSNDGTLVAYCKTTSETSKTLVIRDIVMTSNLQEIDLGAVPTCAATAFSPDDMTLAVSIVHYPAFETTPDGEARWSLNLLNVSDGTIQSTLNDLNPNMPAYDLFGDDVPLLADVKIFAEDSLTFWGIPFVGMGGPSYVPAYTWRLSDDSVTEQPREYGIMGSDLLLPSGELIYPALDESLPAAQPEGPIPQANVVELLRPEQDPITIFTIDGWIILNATFINNGQAIAVLSVPGFSEMATAQGLQSTRLDVINRDGTATLVGSYVDSYATLEAVDGGMVVVHTPNPTLDGTYPPTQIAFWNGETMQQIATYAPDYSNMWSPPQLIWTSLSISDTDLAPFTAMN